MVEERGPSQSRKGRRTGAGPSKDEIDPNMCHAHGRPDHSSLSSTSWHMIAVPEVDCIVSDCDGRTRGD